MEPGLRSEGRKAVGGIGHFSAIHDHFSVVLFKLSQGLGTDETLIAIIALVYRQDKLSCTVCKISNEASRNNGVVISVT